MGEILYFSNTDGSATGLPGSDTSLLAGNVKPNHYTKTRISATVFLAMNASAAARTITLKIKQGSTTLETVTVVTGAGATIGAVSFNQHLEYVGGIQAGGSISITAAGSSADATNTQLTGTKLYIEGIE